MTKQGTASPMANPLIAAVCDIRGFTDFTSTVDCVNQSKQVDLGRKTRLLKDYDDLVKNTQLITIQAILRPLIEELKKKDSELRNEWVKNCGEEDRPVPCALKSTGDGFLVAVELTYRYTNVPLKLQSMLAEGLTCGVTDLVRDAKGDGQFRSMLKGFVDVWGDLLALRLGETTFRVAGAIALGTGQILDTEDVPDTWAAADMLKNLVGDPPVLKLKSDAYGHGVNLAFRLCDRAGREKKKGDDENMGRPYVLLDRRIGQLLTYEVPPSRSGEWVTLPWRRSKQQPFKMRIFDGYSPTRFRFDEPLKGIDELWCYALEEACPVGSPKIAAPKGASKKAAKRPSLG